LEACSELFKERSDLQIVIAGDNRLRHPGRLQRWVNELGLVDRVRLLGWVDDSTLAALYRSAELSLYVSTYEGFGIPPLESLAFGSPALVGPGLALDEIWPDYPYRVSRFERADMVDMMRRMLGDPAGTADVMDSARGVLARLDWRDSSRRLVEELGRAVQP
jgi:glycosyltransferase involved in cell wall biosynthesis